MYIAEQIKQKLTMTDVLHRYGFQVDRDRIPCPIHKGKDNNFKYREKSFKCYVCGACGTVIDFTMLLFGITFGQAIVRLNSDFCLGLTNEKSDPRELKRLQDERHTAERARQAYEDEYWEKVNEQRRLWIARIYKVPAIHKEPMTDADIEKAWSEIDNEYIEGLQKLDYLDYWFDNNTAPR